MSDLLTAEELAREWLSGRVLADANQIVQTLLNEVVDLRRDLRLAVAAKTRLGEQLNKLTQEKLRAVDRVVAVRMRAASEALGRLKEACEDLQVELGEDWR